jgi:nucleoside-diphosphate-sugar epimerase
MTIRDARILITGASGFIGSHLARACVREGATVTCLLRPGSDPWRLLDARPAATIRTVDLANEEAVRAAVMETAPDVMFHLIGDTRRARDLALYESLHAAHVTSTRNLVSAALALPRPPRFISTGTIEEYGRGPVPFVESQRESPVTPYSVTKLEGSRLVEYASREQGLPGVILRPALTYGPLKGKGMFIPDFIRAAMTTKAFKMSPGEQTRDCIYVDDVVRAYLAAATTEGIEGEIFNVGTGVETRMKDIAESLRALCGGDVAIEYGAYPCDPRVETMRCVMDVQKAKERLSWQPSLTLAEGLSRTVEWYLTSSSAYEHLWE